MAYEGSHEKFAPVEVDEVGQIILKARELLSDPKRWCKRHFVSSGSFCVLGALGARSQRVPVKLRAAAERIANAIPKDYPFRFWPDSASLKIQEFNDSDTTTHADVLALLDRASKAES